MSKRIDSYALQDLTTSDKLFGVDAGGDTRQYTPGTAASSDVQTSSTDTTADRLMAVGAFGLGTDIDLNDYPSDSAWTTTTSLDNGWTGTIKYIKRLGWVTVSIFSIDGSSRTSSGVITLPSEYRPSERIDFVHTDSDQGNVQSSGLLSVIGTGTDIRAFITYPVL